MLLQQVNSPDGPYLLGNEAKLFSRQVVELKDKPPVEVTVSIQRPVVDVSFLLVLLHAWHPAGKGGKRNFYSLTYIAPKLKKKNFKLLT